jgi:hypothetical protein
MDGFFNKFLVEQRKKWSEDELRNVALQYNRRKQFYDDNPKAYGAAKWRGQEFFDDITSHMEDGRKFQEVKWTDEVLKDLTQKYNDLQKFRLENPQAYNALLRKDKTFFNELTSHMNRRPLKYSDDDLRLIAKKYDNLIDFTNNDGGALVAARKRGENFFNDITKHIVKKSRDPYTYEEVKKEASKYNTIGEFQKNNVGAYNAARRNGWSESVTSHMIPVRNSWSIGEIKELAKNYGTLKDFRENNSAAYSWSLNNLSEEDRKSVFGHMKKIGNYANRMIYAFEFPDKSVYVGLTFDADKRESQHKRDVKSAVLSYQNKTGLKPTFKHVTDYISMDDASVKEGEVVKDYLGNGWKILNRTKTGALGSIILKWTYDKVKEEALKYKTRSEFENKNGSAYYAAKKRGWFDEVTSHMGEGKKIKYSKEELIDIAKKYTKLKDFRDNDNGAYQAAKKYGDEFFTYITSHIDKSQKRSMWNNYENVRQEALRYNNLSDFRKGSRAAYRKAHEYGWLPELKILLSKINK